MIMYNAHLRGDAYFQALASPAFNFGINNFSLAGMITTRNGGPIVSRLGTKGGGFLLIINPDSTIAFVTSDGTSTYQVKTVATTVLDGGCHALAAIRQGASMQILLDGLALPVTGSGSGRSPLNINNNLPLQIGATQADQPVTRLVGTLMNVGVWNAALVGGQLVAASFARVQADNTGLQGYWTFNSTTNDLSRNNNPASIVGPVRFQPCVNCVWTSGANAYGFCQMSNTPTVEQLADPELRSNEPITQFREIKVSSGVPALYASIMSDADRPSFPTGVTVVITDPNGRVYNQDTNNDTTFVVTRDGQPWGIAIVNPHPGAWRVAVTAPAPRGFLLQFQTCPSTAVVSTVVDALKPLYGSGPGAPQANLSDWLKLLTIVAVAALVGVSVAGLVVLSGGTAIPAIYAGIVFFAGVSTAAAAAALPAISTDSLATASTQVGGMAGFLIAVDGLLLIDANLPDDEATRATYTRRKKVLYEQCVELSPFSKKQLSLIGEQDTRTNVAARLRSFGAGYVTASGNGMPGYLTGWYVTGTSGPLQQVLTKNSYDPEEVRGKIIHFFACKCGQVKDGVLSLGHNLVTNGAVAFFGYSETYILPKGYLNSPQSAFCDCDIEIDKALIAGKTCEEAYRAAIGKYNSTIARLRAEGDYFNAGNLEKNRDRLVAPSTDPAYGNKNARLNVNVQP